MTPDQFFILIGAGAYAVGFLYLGYVLWVLFLAVMNLLRVYQKGELPKGVLYLSFPLLAAGLVVDVLFNIVFGTIMFLQMPALSRLTLSARMDDLILTGSGWRKKFAIWFVKYLLQPFDTSGMHTTHGN